MLAAICGEQPVERVIGIAGAGRDHLVVEVDRLLRVVADGGGVAGRVVGVKQILERRPCAQRLELVQPEGQRVVSVRGRDAVAVHDALALALRVVVDVADKRCRRRRAAQVDADLLKEIGLVIDSAGRRSDRVW